MSQTVATGRRALGFLPTPLVAAPRLSAALGGPRIWIKRDDQTGLALGGNKTRKLEYLVGAALRDGADTLVTGGAAQSNHCRQTAAAAAACGFECHLVLGGEEPARRDGNLLLDGLFGAHVHWAGERRRGEDMPRIADELRAAGRRPVVVPYGGSNEIGATGFVQAVRELGEQMREQQLEFGHVVFASSSGGTHAGLAVGRAWYGHTFEPVAIAVDKEDAGTADYGDHVAALAGRTADRLGLPYRFGRNDIRLRAEYTGGGYGVMGEAEREAIRLAATTEGILLDPVYSGRAMAGLIDMVRRGELGPEDRVLFWHTGGTPALFAYADEL